MRYTGYIVRFCYMEGIVQMGKKWRYHPISLMTIRGAAAQHGFELGRITQTQEPNPGGSAQYRATVKSWPAGWDKKSQAVQRSWFNNCFSLDIWCTWAGMNVHGEYLVNLTTQLVPDEDETVVAGMGFEGEPPEVPIYEDENGPVGG